MTESFVYLLVLWPFLTTVGVFIDQYHLKKNLKTKVQNRLIAAFVWLDDLPKRVLGGSRKEVIPPTWAYIPIAIPYIGWLLWWSWTRGSVLGARWGGAVDNTVTRWIAVGAAYVLKFFEASLLGLLALLVFFVLFILLMLVITVVVEVLRRLLMEILSVASDPQHSPFTYAGALLGFVLACARFVIDYFSQSQAGAL